MELSSKMSDYLGAAILLDRKDDANSDRSQIAHFVISPTDESLVNTVLKAREERLEKAAAATLAVVAEETATPIEQGQVYRDQRETPPAPLAIASA